jgi:hypothetical protein
LQEKIYFAWKMYRYEQVGKVQAPTLAQLDGYQRLVNDAKRLYAKRLYAKRVALRGMLAESSVVRYAPDLLKDYGPCWSRALARALNSDSNGPSADCASPSDLPSLGSDLPKQDAPTVDKDACLKVPPASNGKFVATEVKIDLEDYESSIACFVRTLQIESDYNHPVDGYIYATRNKVQLLVSWLLPGLYGLLGACVFLMRKLLFVSGGRRGRGDTRIVDLLSLVLRIALGGLAGIIIGWFWVPTALTSNSSAIAVSSVPFGMAFLAGFSIDSLFALLDRLNRTIGQDDAKDKDAEAERLAERAAEKTAQKAAERAAGKAPDVAATRVAG